MSNNAVSAMSGDQAIQVKASLQAWQRDMLALLRGVDSTAQTIEDAWQHETGGGGGKTCVLTGDVIERAGR